MSHLQMLVLTDGDATPTELATLLEESGPVRVVDVVSDLGALAGRMAVHRPDLLFVQLGEKADLQLDAVEALPRPHPILLAAGPAEQGRLVLRSVRAGAREYLPVESLAEELEECFARLLPALELPEDSTRIAPLVAVLGAKGGVGATLVSCQLAACLQERCGQAVLVDLDLRHGDAHVYLDLQPAYDLAEVARSEGPLDATFVRTLVQDHASGMRVLAAPDRHEEAEIVRPSHVERALGLLRRDADWVVADLGREFDENTLRALDLADAIVLVTTMEVPALHHTRRILGLLERLGHPLSGVHVVVSRYDRSSAVSDRDFAEFLGRHAEMRIPNDFAAVQECLCHGRLPGQIAPSGGIQRAFEELALLACDWVGIQRPESEEAPGGLRRIGQLLKRRLHGAD